jgi:hypothetical protein
MNVINVHGEKVKTGKFFRCKTKNFLFFIGLHKMCDTVSNVHGKGKGKGKAIPLQAWTGPEESRRFRLPDFKTIGT